VALDEHAVRGHLPALVGEHQLFVGAGVFDHGKSFYCNCRQARDVAVVVVLPASASALPACYDVDMAKDDDDGGLARRIATKAALSAGRDALERLTLSDDEKAARAAARARATKKKLLIAIVVATVGLVGAIVLLQWLASLWMWAVGAVVVAGALGVTALVLKPRIDALRRRLDERRAAKAAAQASVEAAERQRQALVAAEQAKAQAQKKLDDDLARLKAKAGR
jgi:hypothetical protein